jgi:hypothetical protein
VRVGRAPAARLVGQLEGDEGLAGRVLELVVVQDLDVLARATGVRARWGS